jgi:hypothetical protein
MLPVLQTIGRAPSLLPASPLPPEQHSEDDSLPPQVPSHAVMTRCELVPRLDIQEAIRTYLPRTKCAAKTHVAAIQEQRNSLLQLPKTPDRLAALPA